MTQQIELTQGQIALVDDEDYEMINQYKWCAVRYKHKDSTVGFYAIRTRYFNSTWERILMHRFILNVKDKRWIDHKNHNTLDNRKENLRACTISQNQANKRKKDHCTSIYKGVSWHKSKFDSKWLAQIGHHNKVYYLGNFDNEIDAAYAYDKAAYEQWGEFANLNFPFQETSTQSLNNDLLWFSI